jgi:GNAT superfamily N-acetyltransferase
MIIRQATSRDVPEMVALLKQSIGEALTPKTEAYFLWKHEKNPFGRSKILVAVEDEKIVGLRTFMHWSWVSGKEKISAVRAVDTATDPAFQGKGIFKKLTLQVVEECKAEAVDMVFNSPNPVSMQGYLKMGWSKVGRLPLYIGIGSLLPAVFSTERISRFYTEYSIQTALEKLGSNWSLPVARHFLHTPLHYMYLGWRYRDCPVANYAAVIEPGKFGFVFRLKKLKKFMELRVCEVWTEPGTDNERLAKAAFKKMLGRIRPALVSCAASPLFSEKNHITKLFGPFKKGPMVTIRTLAKNNLNNFEQFSHWQPSLGSMELF